MKKKSNILAINFAGLECPNPVVVASCPLTATVDGIVACAEAGAGAVITKSMGVFGPAAVTGMRRVLYDKHGLWMLSSVQREILSWETGLSLLKHALQEVHIPVIPSLAADTFEPDAWLPIACKLKNAGAPAIHVDGYYLPRPWCQEPHRSDLHTLLSILSEALNIPVFLKLNSDCPVSWLEKEATDFDVDGWALLDSVRVANPIDRITGRPNYRRIKTAGTCSLAGPWLKPLSLLYTSVLATVSPAPILAGGGLMSVDDALEAISYGASAVQFATLFLIEGITRISDLVKGLELACRDLGIKDVSQLRERAHHSINEGGDSVCEPAVAVINETDCTRCGRCAQISMCNAITESDNQVVIKSAECEGCGLCAEICPAGAISIIPRSIEGFRVMPLRFPVCTF